MGGVFTCRLFSLIWALDYRNGSIESGYKDVRTLKCSSDVRVFFFFIQEMVELDALIVFSGRLRPGNLVKLCTLKLCVTWLCTCCLVISTDILKMPSSDHSAMSNQPVMTCMCLVSKLSCFNSARSWWVCLLSTLGSGHVASTIYKG